MDKTIVPTNFQSWPKIKPLLPEQKLLARELWCNPFVTPCGCYPIDIEMFSAQLGFNSLNVIEALKRFEEIKLIKIDWIVSEILILDWWRFHSCLGAKQEAIIQKSVDKIQSDVLRDEFFKRIIHVSKNIKDLRPNITTSQSSSLNEQQPQDAQAEDFNMTADSSGLVFPKKLDPEYVNDLLLLLQNRNDGQHILDELAVYLSKNSIEVNPVALVKGIIKNGLTRSVEGKKMEELRLSKINENKKH